MKQFFEISEVEKKVKEKKQKKVSANSSKPTTNLFLKNVTFKEDFRNLKKGLSIDFKPLTLLVGEQGSGKSSLLKLLSENDRKILKFDLSEETIKLGIKTYFFDTEKHNPRVRDMHEYTNMDGSSKGIGLGGKLSSHFQSHGEVLKSMTIDLINKQNEPCVLFLDEPESALSIKNQVKLFESIQNVLKKDCQVIIATHCLTLIQKVDWVYDMEINQWVRSKHFIDNSFGKDSYSSDNPYNIFLNGNDEKIDELLNYDNYFSKKRFIDYKDYFLENFDLLLDKTKLKFILKCLTLDNFLFYFYSGEKHFLSVPVWFLKKYNINIEEIVDFKLLKDLMKNKSKIGEENKKGYSIFLSTYNNYNEIVTKKLTQILNELQ
jgi:predicted ATPase